MDRNEQSGAQRRLAREQVMARHGNGPLSNGPSHVETGDAGTPPHMEHKHDTTPDSHATI